MAVRQGSAGVPVPRGDEGAAILVAVVLVHLLALLTMVGAMLGSLAVVRAQAGAVADLAALAAAAAPMDPCGAAAVTAQGNWMALASCDLVHADVHLVVSAQPPPLVTRVLAMLGRGSVSIRASARAGPPAG